MNCDCFCSLWFLRKSFIFFFFVFCFILLFFSLYFSCSPKSVFFPASLLLLLCVVFRFKFIIDVVVISVVSIWITMVSDPMSGVWCVSETQAIYGIWEEVKKKTSKLLSNLLVTPIRATTNTQIALRFRRSFFSFENSDSTEKFEYTKHEFLHYPYLDLIAIHRHTLTKNVITLNLRQSFFFSCIYVAQYKCVYAMYT